MRYKKILLFSVGAFLSLGMLAPLVSCNIPQGRNRKNNQISDNLLYKSLAGKKLKKLIENKFSAAMLSSAWVNYNYHKYLKATKDILFNGSIIKKNDYYMSDNQGKPFLPLISRIKSEKEALNYLRNTDISDGTPRGNYAGSILSSVEWDIIHNDAIDPKIRGLLNEVLTVYNRSKKVYPISAHIVQHDGLKWIQYRFNVDFISTLTKRFMKKYTTLLGEIPLAVPTQKRVNNIYQTFIAKANYQGITASFDTLTNLNLDIYPKTTIEKNDNILSLKQLLLDHSNVANNLYFVKLINIIKQIKNNLIFLNHYHNRYFPYLRKKDLFDQGKFNHILENINEIKYREINNQYQIFFNQYSVQEVKGIDIEKATESFEGVILKINQLISTKELDQIAKKRAVQKLITNSLFYQNINNMAFLKWTKSKVNLVTLNKTDKLSQLSVVIKKKIFTNSQIPFLKEIFQNGDFKIKIDFQSNAGTTIAGYTAIDFFNHMTKYSKIMYSIASNSESKEVLEYYFAGRIGQ